ncbi:MAG: chemotaxis-specific protein-glutamate methyltransferase CheB [Bacteroidota bacterium]
MIKVLLAEDSPVMQQFLIHAISSDPEIEIVGVANNGEEAVAAVKNYHPDVIAMDWQMPKLDGLQATRIIMETMPTPIVIVTGLVSAKDAAFSFRMMEAGALAVISKPHSAVHPEYMNDVKKLNQTLKLMSEIKLVKRFSHTSTTSVVVQPGIENSHRSGSDIRLVAIGASTGGPIVLQKIFSELPEHLPVPLLIVQHISPGFVGGFVEWLQMTTKFPLHLAAHGDLLLPGHGYIAPDDFQMGVGSGLRIVLSNDGMENGLRPSVAHLFHSVAINIGAGAVGILLTGMGKDGAEELKLMKEKGAITIAQDKRSSIIHGMPGEAIKINAALYILSPEEISGMLVSLLKKVDLVGVSL